MNRSVTLLLVPMLLLGHLLPHAHAGDSVDRPDDHSARPHVHLAMHGHGHSHGKTATHGHSDDATATHGHHEHDVQQLAVDRPSGDPLDLFAVNQHDDDAVYLANTATSHHRLNGGIQNTSASAQCFVPEHFVCRAMLGWQSTGPSQRYSSVPIYLLTASLRL